MIIGAASSRDAIGKFACNAKQVQSRDASNDRYNESAVGQRRRDADVDVLVHLQAFGMPAAIELGYRLQRLDAGGQKIRRQCERGAAAFKIGSPVLPVRQYDAQVHLEYGRHVWRGVQQTGHHALGNLHSHARVRHKYFGGDLLR